MNGKTVIVDYGMGNLHSVYKKLLRLKANVAVSSDKIVISAADKLVLPGVGHFAKAMHNIDELGLKDVLNNFVLIQKKPILGICLGMQIMATNSEEGNCSGFGWLDANVVKFKHDNKKFRNPHMGWNNVQIKKNSILMKDISEMDEFYFVHSFHYLTNNQADVLNETEYGYTFCSAVEKENIFGVQYHPEKSHESGERLLGNFLSI
ncbi:MAG: imidazole glycerol phosphate synthase subunit HisH [Bacteroidales bacterium]|nr:imidazole glycerol phosphate synthase subunit HisH [Bacteroidales bacterium]